LTLAFGLVVLPVAALVGPLGGEPGLVVRVPEAAPRVRVWVALAVTGLVLAWLTRLQRGRVGLVLRAVRDDEVAAALGGIRVARTRVLAFLVSAGPAGLAGGLYVWLTGTVLPGYFGLSLSLYLLVAVVLGGAGSLVGAAVGTLFVVAVPPLMSAVVHHFDPSPAVVARLTGNAPLALLGLVLIIVTAARGSWATWATSWHRSPGRQRDGAAYENEPSYPREDGVRPP
jgi:branched-chain amino acid transport system permease protein